ncbi:hypothetical protein ONS95_011353 [Cadophora gregata]|uniref:uncharacterized protein n=1 Tax=Cadophora gregata TaxID=51156 RepID=UPI0026DAF4CE|nr:uncharacterized protein ONS95_011353 [Cadophora gregata]KAK0119928.1 hypothetical protein ONS95_011353 [Cadophora gregata]
MSSGPKSKGSTVIVTGIVFMVLAAVSVIFRLIARVGYLKNAGKDDAAIVVSLIACIVLVVASGFEVKHGLGKHISEVSPEEFSNMLKSLFIAIIAYNVALTSIKISIILQYLRVFVGTKIRFWCWASIVLVAVFGLETVITQIFNCVPIDAFWLGGGKCIPNQFLWFFNAAFNILTDIIILVLPMPVLSSLRLPLKQKIGLMLVFALGGFVCLVSVLRLHGLYISSISKDMTWDNADTATWSNIEVTVGIICACMPATKALISRFFPRLLSTNHSSRQPTMPSQGRSHTFRSGLCHTAPVRLTDLNGDHKTVTRVGVGEGRYRERDVERASIDDSGSGNGKDIFVTTIMTQDVERKSEVGSEKGLIIQHN